MLTVFDSDVLKLTGFYLFLSSLPTVTDACGTEEDAAASIMVDHRTIITERDSGDGARRNGAGQDEELLSDAVDDHDSPPKINHLSAAYSTSSPSATHPSSTSSTSSWVVAVGRRLLLSSFCLLYVAVVGGGAGRLNNLLLDDTMC